MAGELRILVGIPTYQELTNIARIVSLVDAAVCQARFSADFTIVNIDNRSPDGTSDAFLATHTITPKVSLLTAEGQRGKGTNLRRLFEYALEADADAAITVDADLHVVPSDWIEKFAAAVIHDGTGLVVPVYPRAWYDASQTNQIVAPAVLAVTGSPVRQPIGGDFGFSPDFMRRLVKRDWTGPATGFGVDSFLVLEAVQKGELGQVVLKGGKYHSWRSRTPDQVEVEFPRKFNEVNSMVLPRLGSWPVEPRLGVLPRFPRTPDIESALLKGCDLGVMVEAARRGYLRERRQEEYLFLFGNGGTGSVPRVDDEQWVDVLTRLLILGQTDAITSAMLSAFQALFFMRLATVQPRLRQLSQAQLDDHVWRLAELLAARRRSPVPRC